MIAKSKYKYMYMQMQIEKQIKDYRREKKIALIKTINPDMIDLYYSIL